MFFIHSNSLDFLKLHFFPNFRVLYGALAHTYVSYTRRLASHVNDCTHSWNKTVAKIMTGLFRGWSNGQIGRQGEYFTKEKWTSISAGRFIGSNLMMRPSTGAHTLWGKINKSSDIKSNENVVRMISQSSLNHRQLDCVPPFLFSSF